MTNTPEGQSPRQPGETDEQYGERLRQEQEAQNKGDESTDSDED